MLTTSQKARLSVIFGDNMEAVGDIVLVRESEETMYLINVDGEMILPNAVFGVGMFLGPGGFNYVVLTKRSNYEEKTTRFGSGFTNSKTLYTYNVYDSNFNWVSVGEARSSGITGFESIGVNLRGKMLDLKLHNGILKEKSNVWM